MVKKEPKRRLKVVKGLAPDPLSTADLEAAEDTLARLVALAYRADHPDLFGAQQGGAEVFLSKVLECAPRAQVENERTFARSA